LTDRAVTETQSEPSEMGMATRVTAVLLAAVIVALLAACVPDPAGRVGEGGSPSPTATATPTPTPPGPTPTPFFARPTPTPQPTFVLYTVRRGDNLTRIAKRFETTSESISYWNRVTYPSLDPESGQYAPNSLQVGWVLQILPKSVVDPENLPTLPPSPEASEEPANSTTP
jgi:hypothetical protein